VTGPEDAPLDWLYHERFDQSLVEVKHAIWRPIARFLQRYVDPARPVLDIACDRGYFIANIRASERWAADLRDMSPYLPTDVRFVQRNGVDLMGAVPEGYFGTVFMSNYLEHLPTPDAVVEQLRVARRLLAPDGRLIVLQPNIRLVGARYWDFIDHRTALTERSLEEAGVMAGLVTEELIVRFLPHTTRSRLPTNPALVRLYLRVRPAWRFLGRQTLWVARRR